MPVAFENVPSIGVFWPWGGPSVVDPYVAEPVYLPNPYVFNRLWEQRMTPAICAQLKAAGFRQVRWQINPGPWLEAMRKNDVARLAYLDGLLNAALDHALANGFSVMFCPFYTGYAGLHDKLPMQGITTPGFLALKALWVHWATLVKDRPPAKVAIEVFNEPPTQSQYPASWEYETQPALYAAMRAAAPKLTIVLTASDYSSPELFVQWNPAGYDDNTIFTFHPLRPVPAVLQGFIYNQYQYINRLHYPPRPQDKAAAIASMTTRVNADVSLSAGAKAQTIAGLRNDLNAYFDLPQDRRWMGGLVDQIAAWADARGIDRRRLHAGEIGMTRDNIGYPGIGVRGYQGGTRLDRIHCYRDWTRELIRLRCRRSPIHLDTNDYGVTFGEDDVVGEFDPLLLRAMRPRS